MELCLRVKFFWPTLQINQMIILAHFLQSADLRLVTVAEVG